MKRSRRDFLKTMTTCAVATSILPAGAPRAEDQPSSDFERMSLEHRAQEALTLMGEYGSCCTGVLGAWAPELGLEIEQVAGLGRGMAGGIGGLGQVCGAVSGAILAIGLKTSNAGNLHDMPAAFETMAAVREFVARFEERHSSIQCRDLMGHDISTQEKSAAAMQAGAFGDCPQFIESAVAILDEMIRTGRI